MSTDLEKVPPSELTSEKSFLGLWYRAAFIKRTRRQLVIWTIYWLMSVGIGFLHASFLWNSLAGAAKLREDLASISEIAFNYSYTMLGFILGGFTIFATISREKFLDALAQKREETTKQPWIKYIFFQFIKSFSVFAILTVVSLTIILFCKPQNTAHIFFSNIDSLYEWNKKLLVCVADFILVVTIFRSFCSAADLIFNTYIVVMMSIRFGRYEE